LGWLDMYGVQMYLQYCAAGAEGGCTYSNTHMCNRIKRHIIQRVTWHIHRLTPLKPNSGKCLSHWQLAQEVTIVDQHDFFLSVFIW
jgi:hypothetical protein